MIYKSQNNIGHFNMPRREKKKITNNSAHGTYSAKVQKVQGNNLKMPRVPKVPKGSMQFLRTTCSLFWGSKGTS